MKCINCGREIELFRGYWWSDDDDMMCPDGETRHEPSSEA